MIRHYGSELKEISQKWNNLTSKGMHVWPVESSFVLKYFVIVEIAIAVQEEINSSKTQVKKKDLGPCYLAMDKWKVVVT